MIAGREDGRTECRNNEGMISRTIENDRGKIESEIGCYLYLPPLIQLCLIE